MVPLDPVVSLELVESLFPEASRDSVLPGDLVSSGDRAASKYLPGSQLLPGSQSLHEIQSLCGVFIGLSGSLDLMAPLNLMAE